MGGSVQSLIFLSGILHNFASSATIGGIRLVTTGGCGCLGETLTYECTVMGGPGGATVWTGTALSCPSDEIVLLHQRFIDPGGAIRSCNNGATVAQSLYVQNNIYISQLNVTVINEIAGRTIMCVYDAMGDHITTHNVVQFSAILPGRISPPNKFYINTVDYATREFTFSWSPVAPDCPAIHYNILASNCGSCPTTTNQTIVTCTDVPINGSTCMFAVQPVICGNISSKWTDSINITTMNTEEIVGPLVDTTTIGEEQIDYNMTLQQPTHTFFTHVSDNYRSNCETTFISSILLATLFITWVPISTLIIFILLNKLNFKLKHGQQMANQGLTTTTNSMCNLESKTVINTSDNVAYGMFSRGRHYL